MYKSRSPVLMLLENSWWRCNMSTYPIQYCAVFPWFPFLVSWANSSYFLINSLVCSAINFFLSPSITLDKSSSSEMNFSRSRPQGLGQQLYWKRDSGSGVSLWILWNFQERLFSQNTSGRLLLKNTPECLMKWLVPSKKSKHFGFTGDILKIISNPSEFWNNHYWGTKTGVLEFHYGYYVKVHTIPFPK